MTTKTWTGSSTSNWNDPNSWSPSGIPVSSDDVVIGTTATSPTLSNAAASANTITINGADTLNLFGSASLDIANGITLSSTGGISGTGSVAAAVTASGPATITATGGILTVGGRITDSGGALTLTIAGPTDELILQSASAANTVIFGSSGTLLLDGAGASLTVGTAMAIGTGSVQLVDASLTDLSGVMVGSSGALIGYGTVTGPISGTGIVEASGSTLELVSAIPASASTVFEIANNTANTLLLDSAPGTGDTFTFLGRGDLALANDIGFNDTISGLNVGTQGAKTNYVDIEGHTVTIRSVTGQGTTSGTITLSDGAVLNLTHLSSTAWFANAVGDGVGTDIFVSDTPCYCRGTLIRTEAGEVAVEDLAIGDKVVAFSGRAQPVKWIGHRAYDPRFVAGSRTVLPIRIEAGALADGVPARDLFVSPEHALYIDGALVPARLLVNGSTIVQVDSVERLEYFHIELDGHNVILAEGAPAETFVDCDNRFMFQNGDAFAALYPGDTPAPWEFCAPRAEPGSAELAVIRAALLARAEALGRVTHDPDLHLIADGEIIRAQSVADGVYSFAIPAGSGAIWLASRSAVPADVKAASPDRRRLGVPLKEIVLRATGRRSEIGHGDPRLCDGVHEDEGGHRWTDGMARLPQELLRPFAGNVTLEVTLIDNGLRYPRDMPEAVTWRRRYRRSA